MCLAKLDGFSVYDLMHRFGYVMAERTPLHRLVLLIIVFSPITDFLNNIALVINVATVFLAANFLLNHK